MQKIIILSVAVIAVILFLFTGSSHKLEITSYGDTNTLKHKKHGYRIELPKKYFEPDEVPPVRTNIDLSTYFQEKGDPRTVFLVGEITQRAAIIPKQALLSLESGAINGDQVIKLFKGKGEATLINGIGVYQNTNIRNKTMNTMVMFVVDDTLIGFVATYSEDKAKEVQYIIESLRRL